MAHLLPILTTASPKPDRVVASPLGPYFLVLAVLTAGIVILVILVVFAAMRRQRAAALKKPAPPTLRNTTQKTSAWVVAGRRAAPDRSPGDTVDLDVGDIRPGDIEPPPADEDDDDIPPRRGDHQ